MSLFVLQLDYKVNWKKLKDVFKLAGNVTRAEIWEDKEGKSRGMATVSFEHPWEAVQAICILEWVKIVEKRLGYLYSQKNKISSLIRSYSFSSFSSTLSQDTTFGTP